MRCTGFICPSPLLSPMASVVSVPGENNTVTIVVGKTILVKQSAPIPDNVRTERAFQFFHLQQYKQQKTHGIYFPAAKMDLRGGRVKGGQYSFLGSKRTDSIASMSVLLSHDILLCQVRTSLCCLSNRQASTRHSYIF